MASASKQTLSDLVHALTDLDASFVKDGRTTQFLEFRANDEECVLYGNRGGLVHVARVILEIAASTTSGSHHTFDEAGMVDEADLPFTVSLKKAPWPEPAA